jgi:hypothetical protein
MNREHDTIEAGKAMPSHHDRAKSTLFIQASGSLRDLYDPRWISYGVFTGMCLYSPVVVITMEV